ncbi:hypothetical protein ACO0K0_16260 [Undibacterium sp. SXout11W]|uniref:hypothetical protein n=1 Tax=Undibacterium sp. SXout11W TaxID=3413050 RepID=UPI003BF13943
MPGNEALVVNYLINNIGNLNLNHIGLVQHVQNPGSNGQNLNINSTMLLRPEDPGKKADIYINGIGVSIKQSGSSFLFNRLQRAEMLAVFERLNFGSPRQSLLKLDTLIESFHNGEFDTRDRHWTECFDANEFYALLKFLMTEGSPNKGLSAHPAQYILTAPSRNISPSNIECLTFDEYFAKYRDVIYISLRRQWIGQSSRSEHARALGLSAKEGNKPWVLDSIAGTPSSGWRHPNDFPIEDRRTVYMTFITVKP